MHGRAWARKLDALRLSQYPPDHGRGRPLQGRLTKEDVDLRMIKALADLPGDRGLEAVDRFSSSSLETVRSKTGFMVRVDLSRLNHSPMTAHDPGPFLGFITDFSLAESS